MRAFHVKLYFIASRDYAKGEKQDAEERESRNPKAFAKRDNTRHRGILCIILTEEESVRGSNPKRCLQNKLKKHSHAATLQDLTIHAFGKQQFSDFHSSEFSIFD